MTALSKYITKEEFERSATAKAHGIPNKMDEHQMENAQQLCVKVLDHIREYYDRPILLSSGYRSPKLNTLVNGSGSSQHMKGQAADFTIKGLSPIKVFWEIAEGEIPGLVYDQLIEEGTWVHISFNINHNQMENLKAIKNSKGKVIDYKRV